MKGGPKSSLRPFLHRVLQFLVLNSSLLKPIIHNWIFRLGTGISIYLLDV